MLRIHPTSDCTRLRGRGNSREMSKSRSRCGTAFVPPRGGRHTRQRQRPVAPAGFRPLRSCPRLVTVAWGQRRAVERARHHDRDHRGGREAHGRALHARRAPADARQSRGPDRSRADPARAALRQRPADGVPVRPAPAGFSRTSAAGAAATRRTRIPGRLPESDEEIAFAPVARLSQWLARGELTSRRLTEIYLARIEDYGAAAGMLRHRDGGPRPGAGGRGRRAAEGGDASWSAARHPLRPQGPVRHAAASAPAGGLCRTRTACRIGTPAIVELLRRAGAVLLGKTTLGALAYNDVWFGGKTRKPMEPRAGLERLEGGFGGGDGGRTGRLQPGHRDTTARSSRRACAGSATGLRPTFGRVGRTGTMPLAGRSTRSARSAEPSRTA